MDIRDLPPWPSRGNRRRLDMLWLERLEAGGSGPLASKFPFNPPLELQRAVEQFNRGQFWECHETLEHLWRATPYPLRHFYQGIIKIAAGYYHVSQHNGRGARAKLSEGLRLLKVFTPELFGIDTQRLHQETMAWLERLTSPGPIDWQTLAVLTPPHIQKAGGNGGQMSKSRGH